MTKYHEELQRLAVPGRRGKLEMLALQRGTTRRRTFEPVQIDCSLVRSVKEAPDWPGHALIAMLNGAYVTVAPSAERVQRALDKDQQRMLDELAKKRYVEVQESADQLDRTCPTHTLIFKVLSHLYEEIEALNRWSNQETHFNTLEGLLKALGNGKVVETCPDCLQEQSTGRRSLDHRYDCWDGFVPAEPNTP